MYTDQELNQATSDSTHQRPWSAKIANTATTEDDKLFVIIPGVSADHRWGPCNWMARPGEAYPVDGQDCIVAFDEKNIPSILLWFPTDDTVRTRLAALEGGSSGGGIPVGASLEWNAAGDPAGGKYMVEDGRTLDSVADPTLAPLFTAIGTLWGGTGASAFKIPDSRGRTAIGAGTGTGLTARTLAAILGTEPSNMPTHAHSGTTSGQNTGHSHTYIVAQICCTIDGGSTANVTNIAGTGNSGGNSVDHSHTVTTGAPNSGDITNNNMQPSIVKNKIIRVR